MDRKENDEKQSDSGYILKLEPKIFADKLDEGMRTSEQLGMSPKVWA